ncbi:septum formation inhibitor Maf [Flagellimonas allohymeniacidonis]|uniref:Septum formation inhibitor Maf n=1 Tax=Flagellimonas allohymeniacidonis TaxID=2517819 RepID=A0A4Q8QH79_9FLAO|nr:septum formation inhibitor Maf [Allomuricauda hymeniacidonis]TAI48628.1 septum formation inhibitor Maf [Allomuricauda hymeniacidonis]
MKTSTLLPIIIFSTTLFLGACMGKTADSSKEMALNNEIVANEKAEVAAKKPLSQDFKKYWYAGNAEITSYELEQARYGELRQGTSVLIYVTEPFLSQKQVKADRNNATNIPVLKLNATKKYLTGIYPYSVMSSTFYPVYDNQHAIKTSLSMQEWCGHVYSQLNNRDAFEFMSHSYFESEADQEFKLEKEVLENEIWTKIRIDPNDLPEGEFKMIPSLEYVRLRHTELKAYDVTASLTKQNGLSTYSITYPQLERTLRINFDSNFPHSIESWTEEFRSGFGPNAKVMTTSAKKLKSLKSAYWGQNGNDDLVLRDSLGL